MFWEMGAGEAPQGSERFLFVCLSLSVSVCLSVFVCLFVCLLVFSVLFSLFPDSLYIDFSFDFSFVASGPASVIFRCEKHRHSVGGGKCPSTRDQHLEAS